MDKQINTITTIPTEIQQCFDSMLLSRPFKLGDDLGIIDSIFKYIENKLSKKLKNLSKKREKYEKLKKEFLDFYVKVEKKEKDNKTSPKNKTRMPFYFIRLSHRGNEELFRRLRKKSIQYSRQ